jgi:hypothetical protein
LNLNKKLLQNNRKKVFAAFQRELEKRGHLSKPVLERMLRQWNGESDHDPLNEFCQVIVYWLRKRLKREQQR